MTGNKINFPKFSQYTVMRRIMMFWSMIDRIYDGGPRRLYYTRVGTLIVAIIYLQLIQKGS